MNTTLAGFLFVFPFIAAKLFLNLIFITYKWPQVGQTFFLQLFVNISSSENYIFTVCRVSFLFSNSRNLLTYANTRHGLHIILSP